MSGDSIFVDSNVLLYALEGKPDVVKLLEGVDVNISFITEMELLSYPKLTAAEAKLVKASLGDCKIWEMSERIKRVAIELRRTHSLKLADAIIAATALISDMALLTADKQLQRVKELNVLVYDPGNIL